MSVWRGVPVCMCLWNMCSAPLLAEPTNRKVADWEGRSPGLGPLDKADTFSIPEHYTAHMYTYKILWECEQLIG